MKTALEDSSPKTKPDGDNVTILTADKNGRALCLCGCTKQVEKGSTFRQGHDARFKGILQRAYVRHSQIVFRDGASRVEADPMQLAKSRGWEHYLIAMQARIDGKQAKKAPKTTKKAVDPATAKAIAKVGRWTYDGLVTSDGAKFTYTDKSGKTKTATQFKVVK